MIQNYVPMVSVKGSVVDSNEKVLWENYAVGSPTSEEFKVRNLGAYFDSSEV